VHANASAYITLADAMGNWQHGSARCFSERDLTGYDFFSVSNEGFVQVSVKPVSEARLGNVVFQSVRKIMLSGYSMARINISLLRTICVRP
jgi:hypothetical protein